MCGLDVKNNSDSNNLNTGYFVFAICLIALIISGAYFVNFNYQSLKVGNWSEIFINLSKDTGKWGTFGDYVGGILNLLIAAFAFLKVMLCKKRN